MKAGGYVYIIYIDILHRTTTNSRQPTTIIAIMEGHPAFSEFFSGVKVGALYMMLAISFVLIRRSDPSKSQYVNDEEKDDATRQQAQASSSSSLPKAHIQPLDSRYTIELCLTNIESVRTALNINPRNPYRTADYGEAMEYEGINSIELCTGLDEGGITPSLGFIQQALQLCRGKDIQVHVLIRPRPGDFEYSDEEFEVILRDIMIAMREGVDGVVCGILRAGRVDKPRMRVLREIAKMQRVMLTFHRAIDVSVDYQQAIEDVIELQCDR